MKNFFTIILLIFISTFVFSQDTKPQLTADTLGNTTFFSQQKTIENNYLESLPEPKFSINNNWWENGLFLLFLTILTIFYVKYTPEINLIFKSYINKNHYNQLKSTQNTIYNNTLTIFNFIFLIIISVIINIYIKDTEIAKKINDKLIFPIILTIVYIFYQFKLLSALTWSYLFEEKIFFKDYYNNIRISNFIQSIFLITTLFIVTYIPFLQGKLFKTTIFIISISFIIRSLNLMLNNLSKGFLFFYVLLYLCTVEILPVLLIFKHLITGLQ